MEASSKLDSGCHDSKGCYTDFVHRSQSVCAERLVISFHAFMSDSLQILMVEEKRQVNSSFDTVINFMRVCEEWSFGVLLFDGTIHLHNSSRPWANGFR